MSCLAQRFYIFCLASILLFPFHGTASDRNQSSTICINEIFTGVPDWVEIANTGPENVDLSGWRLRSWSSGIDGFQSENTAQVIPEGTVLEPGGFFVISDDPVLSCSVPSNPSFPWSSFEGLAILLERNDGSHADLVIAGGMFGTPDLSSVTDLRFDPPYPYRNRDDLIRKTVWEDNDRGSDWKCGGLLSPCCPNPGQDEEGFNPCPRDETKASPESQDGSYSVEKAGQFQTEQREEGFKSRKVVIAVIDGLRYEDAFLPSESPWMPNLQNTLKPRGVFLDQIYNMGMTITGPGHAAMVTGSGLPTKNNSYQHDNIFMSVPNIFEYYLKDLETKGYPPDSVRQKTCQIYGKHEECNNMACSIHPAFGTPYRSRILFPDYPDIWHQDLKTFDATLKDMSMYHPDILLINFAQTDQQGHLGDFDCYEYSVRKCDELVDALWRFIQSDPEYKDRTTLFITTDHGRNDDSHGGYRHHGCPCEGCRHVFLLTLGPDTPENKISHTFRTLNDLCPSIAPIFGLDACYSEGQYMPELFYPNLGTKPKVSDPVSLSGTPGNSRDPVIASFGNQVVAGWMEAMETGWTPVIRKSFDGGNSWEEMQDIPEPDGSERSQWIDLAFNRDGNVWALITTYQNQALRSSPAEWFTYFMNIDQSIVVSRDNIGKNGTPPFLSADDYHLQYALAYMFPGSEGPGVSEDEIRVTYVEEPGYRCRTESAVSGELKTAYPHFARIRDLCHAVFQSYADFEWNIGYCRSTDGGLTWQNRTVLEPEPLRVIQKPRVVAQGTNVLIVFAEKEIETSRWKVMCLTSMDTGLTWGSPFMLSEEGNDILYPAVVSDNNSISVVWSRFQDGGSSIAGKISRDGGRTWSSEQIWVGDRSLASRPDAVKSGKDMVLTWSEDFHGQTEIYIRRIEGIFEPPSDHPLGVELWMPGMEFSPGILCSCWITLHNPYPETLTGIPLFALLEIAGKYYFWPSFWGMDYETVDIIPGRSFYPILPEFPWPDLGNESGSACWHAALLSPDFSGILGQPDTFEFNWR